MYYENFISYRRNECAHEARKLFEALARRGFSTFCDVFTLNSGKFDDKLLETISACTNYILLIGPHSLEWRGESDWLYREIEQALAKKRNIIPVFVDGYTFPKSLPDSIGILTKMNGLKYSDIYFDGFVDALVARFLITDQEISVRKSPDDFIISNGELLILLEPGRRIEVPEGVSTIGRNAFKDCTEIESIKLPESLTTIGDSAFERCGSLEIVKLPSKISRIGHRSFSRCYRLGYVEFNDELSEIGSHAFSFCTKIKSVQLGSNLKSLSPSAFNGCRSLSQIKVSPSSAAYMDLDGIVLSADAKTLVRCPEHYANKHIVVPASVENIGPWAFSGCVDVERVELQGIIVSIGARAFEDCINMARLDIQLSSDAEIADDAFRGWTHDRIEQVMPLPAAAALSSIAQRSANVSELRHTDIVQHEFIMVKTALESKEEAYGLADSLVRRKLATSVQIKKMRSVYSWEGQICSENEYELTCITTGYMYFSVVDFITAHHSYELGEIICIPVLATTSEFGKWIDDNVQGAEEMFGND